MDIIVGTAGHIDHGKTALVKALTGVDADRLPEEKQRGITIDLGFAEMHAGDTHFGFVDVPGHERFVKNMLAGASGIDIVMLVIAADEGVMPQTREHFDICRLLRIKSGVIALTKTDLVDDETLEFVRAETAELVKDSFLENAPLFAVSSRNGDGISELKDGLADAARNIRREKEIYEARLPIDRTFSMKGFGAVVTGTLGSGEISEGDELELQPAGLKVRVRGIQTHGNAVAVAHSGQRTAVNLGGVNTEQIERGMVLVAPGTLTVTQIFDAEVEVLADAPAPLRSRQRVRINIGTAEVLARLSIIDDHGTIASGSSGFLQFRLEEPVAAAIGDRFIVRSYSPQRTIAGGRILDPNAQRHRRSGLAKTTSTLNELAAAADGEGNVAEIVISMSGEKGARPSDVRAATRLRSNVISERMSEAVDAHHAIAADDVFVSAEVFEKLRQETVDAVETYHRNDKLSRGLSRETLREQVFRFAAPELFRSVTGALEREGKIVFDQDVFKLASHEAKLSPAETTVRDRLRKIYSDARLEVPKLDDALRDGAASTTLDWAAARKIFQLLLNSGELVPVTQEFYVRADVLQELADKLREFANKSTDRMIDVGKFKEIAGISRKYAIPLLEYYDRSRVTRRVGDKRQIL